MANQEGGVVFATLVFVLWSNNCIMFGLAIRDCVTNVF